jgi:hypothetical protein
MDRLRTNIVAELERTKELYQRGLADNRVLAKLNWLALYFNCSFPNSAAIDCDNSGFNLD